MPCAGSRRAASPTRWAAMTAWWGETGGGGGPGRGGGGGWARPAGRRAVVPAVPAPRRNGGFVLTSPAGQIEPDPASMPGAVASLQDWSESIAIFARLVPQAQVVGAIVSGGIWPAA